MMTATTIYGYVGDGFIVCPGCYDPATDGRPGGPEGISPLYSFDLQGYGHTCDGCHEWVEQPYIYETHVAGDWSVLGRTGWDLDDVPAEIDADHPDLGDVVAELVQLDAPYGWAFAAVNDGDVLALFQSPDNPLRGIDAAAEALVVTRLHADRRL